MTEHLNTSAEEEIIQLGKPKHVGYSFDEVIGFIEELLVDDEFNTKQKQFMELYYKEFNEDEENKLIYTEIFNKYTEAMESQIFLRIKKNIKDFCMESFMKELKLHKDDLEGEVFEVLLTFTDFLAFKEAMLDYKAMKNNTDIDLTSGIQVISLQ